MVKYIIEIILCLSLGINIQLLKNLFTFNCLYQWHLTFSLFETSSESFCGLMGLVKPFLFRMPFLLLQFFISLSLTQLILCFWIVFLADHLSFTLCFNSIFFFIFFFFIIAFCIFVRGNLNWQSIWSFQGLQSRITIASPRVWVHIDRKFKIDRMNFTLEWVYLSEITLFRSV